MCGKLITCILHTTQGVILNIAGKTVTNVTVQMVIRYSHSQLLVVALSPSNPINVITRQSCSLPLLAAVRQQLSPSHSTLGLKRSSDTLGLKRSSNTLGMKKSSDTLGMKRRSNTL